MFAGKAKNPPLLEVPENKFQHSLDVGNILPRTDTLNFFPLSIILNGKGLYDNDTREHFHNFFWQNLQF
jgi:hypothetical protein